jgi:prepilin-type N-terminal cleavage/methylation domain-containing protein
MIFKRHDGFSLIEIIMALMIVGLITTISTSLFIFGLRSFNTTTRQITQHDIVTEITRRISKDIQEASAYNFRLNVTEGAIESYSELFLQFPSTPSGIIPTPAALNWKSWKIQDGKLSVQVGPKTTYSVSDYNPNNYKEVLSNIDTSEFKEKSGNITLKSRFQEVNKTLLLCLKPKTTNVTIHKNRNILEPIITEYSVKYKDLLDINTP